MEHSIMWSFVFLVILGGIIATAFAPTITGNVVEELDCNACQGTPVCAVLSKTALDFENACEATCANARIIHDGYCAGIPVID